MSKMYSASESAFTLIELLVVIAVIGILAAVAVPQFNEHRIKAFNRRAQTDLGNAVTAQEAAYLDREVYWDCMNAGCNDPALPGMKISPQISMACTPREDGQQYRCSALHPNGSLTYYYDSEAATFWEE